MKFKFEVSECLNCELEIRKLIGQDDQSFTHTFSGKYRCDIICYAEPRGTRGYST